MTLTNCFSGLLFLFVFSLAQAQSVFKATPTEDNSIIIEGTSNIHDWEIVVEDFSSEMDIAQSNSKPSSISSISLTIPVKSFNSGKGRMDKNTYEALEADTHTFISFTSSSASTLKESSSGVYTALVKGNLNIAGTTRQVEIPLELSQSGKGYKLKAEKDLTMLDYGVEPPSALFGTITTGEIVNIIFNLNHYKS